MDATDDSPGPGFRKAGTLADLSGGRLRIDLPGGEAVVLRSGDRFYAIQASCPHQRGPLGEGPVLGRFLRCPLHLWKFDLEDGTTLIDRRVVADVFDVRVEGQEVWVSETPRPREAGGGRRRARR